VAVVDEYALGRAALESGATSVGFVHLNVGTVPTGDASLPFWGSLQPSTSLDPGRGTELLELHADLADLTGDERKRRIPEVLQLVGLGDRGDDRIRTYSKGMLQRIGLAQAIVHNPRLVLLDEPTSALDPIGRREVRDLIRGLSAGGITVFLNSHLLSEVEMVCDRVAIIDRGNVVRSGRLDDLVRGAPELNITVDRVDGDLLAILTRFGQVLEHDVATATIRLGVADPSVASVIADVLPRSGYRAMSCSTRSSAINNSSPADAKRLPRVVACAATL